MRWPWSNAAPVEKRDSSYTDALVRLLQTVATGETDSVSTTAAVEAASGIVSRGFAAAVVEEAPAVVEAALSAEVLAGIGRELVRRGESMHLIELRGGELYLRPVGQWDIRGGPDPATWMVRCDLFGPTESGARFVSFDSVLHCTWSVDPARPWRGLGPLQAAALSGSLYAGAVGALRADMRATGAQVIPMPPGDDSEGDDDPLAELQAAVKAAKGGSIFAETTRAAGGGDHRDAPAEDWKQRRLGPSPDEVLATVHESAAWAVLASCGIDPVLAGLKDGDGPLAREVYRRFERLTLGPLARQVEQEIRFKLDAPDLRFSFDSLRASDFAGIARSFKALVEAGLTPEQSSAILDLRI